MKIKDEVPQNTIEATTTLLSPYIKDLTADKLVRAIESYQDSKQPIETTELLKPITIKQACELLNMSKPTINRYLNNGKLKRLKLSKNAVRIDLTSVKALLEQGAM